MAGINEKLSNFLSEIRKSRKRSWSSSSDCSSCSCPSSCSCRASPEPEVLAHYGERESNKKASYQNLLHAREALRKLLFYETQKKEHKELKDHHEESNSSHSETLPTKSLQDRLNLFYEKVKMGDVDTYSQSNKPRNETIRKKSLQERLNIFYQKVKMGNASVDSKRTSSNQETKRIVYANEDEKCESSHTSDISNRGRYLPDQVSDQYCVKASQANQPENSFSSIRKVTLKPKTMPNIATSEKLKNSIAVPINDDASSEIVYDSKSEGELTDDSEAEIQNTITQIYPLKEDKLLSTQVLKEKGKSRNSKKHSSSEDLTDHSSNYKHIKSSKRKHETTEHKLEKDKTLKRYLKPEKHKSKRYGYDTDSSEGYYDKKSKLLKKPSSSDQSSHKSYSPYPDKECNGEKNRIRRYTGSIYSEKSSPSKHSHYEEKGHSRPADKHGRTHDEVKHHQEHKENVPYKAVRSSESPIHKSYDSDTRSQSSNHKKYETEYKSDHKYGKSTECHSQSHSYPEKYVPHSSEGSNLVEKEKTLRRVLNAEMVRKIQKASKANEKVIDEKQAEQYFQTFISKIAENYVTRMIKTSYDAAVSEPNKIPEMTAAVPSPNIQQTLITPEFQVAAATNFAAPQHGNALLATPAPTVTLEDMEEFLRKLKANKKGMMIQQKEK